MRLVSIEVKPQNREWKHIGTGPRGGYIHRYIHVYERGQYIQVIHANGAKWTYHRKLGPKMMSDRVRDVVDRILEGGV